jgi:hypothetical protein
MISHPDIVSYAARVRGRHRHTGTQAHRHTGTQAQRSTQATGQCGQLGAGRKQGGRRGDGKQQAGAQAGKAAGRQKEGVRTRLRSEDQCECASVQCAVCSVQCAVPTLAAQYGAQRLAVRLLTHSLPIPRMLYTHPSPWGWYSVV